MRAAPIRTMSSLITIANVKRMPAAQLADKLLAEQGAGVAPADSRVAIVDVRDDDYIGGHIRDCHHFPSRSLDATMPTLLRKLADKPVVVFHCALSQQRGPSAALQYLRARAAAAEQAAQKEGGGDAAKKTAGEGAAPDQLVYVLDRGFVGWQEVYGPDERLTEGWRKEIWDEY